MRARRHQERDWEDLASVDAFGAILRDPARAGRRWKLEEFFATGERDAERVLEAAAAYGRPRHFVRALDFGCGVGRVARALASRFDEVVGLDISPTMVERARTLNADLPNCTFLVGDSSALRGAESGPFDFVLSLLVLQHLRSRAEYERTLARLVRVVASDGALVFQAPDRVPLRRRIQSRRRAYLLLRSLGVPARVLLERLRLDPIRTLALSEDDVRAVLEREGGVILAAETDDAAGPHVPSRRYVVSGARLKRGRALRWT